MRWVRRVIAGLVVLLLLAVALVWVQSNRQLSRQVDVVAEPLPIPTDSAALARGAHLASAIGKCIDCHGEDLAGTLMDLGPVGKFAAPNLTRGTGGRGNEFTIADWVRAIRHGAGPHGRALLLMPSAAYAGFSEDDLAAVIAWVQSVPPVDSVLPPTRLGPVGRLILARSPEKLVAIVAMASAPPFPVPVPPGPTAEYGAYLVVPGGCTTCHGPGLKGGIHEGPPDVPNSADLTPAGPMAQWSEADFRNALRTGVRPDGTTINPFMPWRLTRLMTDEEITAVWLYLRSL